VLVVKGKTAAPAAKAAVAKKAALKGVNGIKSRKIRPSATFRRPKTLQLARKPRYPRRSIPRVASLDQYSVLKFPLNVSFK
jgi:large subunit ribosomal protein L23Ae